MGYENEMGAKVPCNTGNNRIIPDNRMEPDGPPDKEYQAFQAKKKQKTTVTYSLEVTVLFDGMPVREAMVSLQEDSGRGQTIDAGLVKFTKEKGTYTILVTFPQDSDYASPPSVTGNLVRDENVTINVQKKNIVSAKIDAEYDVILLDRGLSQYQDALEKKIHANNVTCVRISFEQSNPAFQYTGEARLSCSAGKVTMYSDKQCLHQFNGIISNGFIKGKSIMYYLKSTAVGAFTCEVTLEQKNDANVQLGNSPVSKAMYVAGVNLDVYVNDHATLKSKKINQDVHPINTYHNVLKNYKLPPQIKLSDQDKIQKGRFLHVQDSDNNARAKIVIKIDPSQWPAESDNYMLKLVNSTGQVKIFDAEVKGKEENPTIKISDLKTQGGNEITYWVEGATASKALHEAMLDISLDRPPGGLQHEEKANADCARFTVVKIQEVKLDYTHVQGQANAWNNTDNRFYINFKADPDGRKINIKAVLSEKIQGVPIHFMLAGDMDNGKAGNWGVDMPNTWRWDQINSSLKHTDRNDRKDFLHLQADTNGNGEAVKDLVLSRFGGDKFTPACYINEDPHLAKYIHGHVELEKKKPVLSLATIQVWRKFWVEPIRFHTIPVIDLRDSVTKFEWVNVEVEVVNEIVLNENDVAQATQMPAFYKKWMIYGGNDMQDIFIATDYNDTNLYQKSVADNTKPLKIPMLLCEGNYGEADPSNALRFDVKIGDFPKEIKTSKVALVPCINDPLLDLLFSGDWEIYDNQNNLLDTGQLLAQDVSIQMGRMDIYYVNIAMPSNIPPMHRARVDKISIIDFSINGADSFAGSCFGGTAVIAYDSRKPNDFHNTIGHEVGHAFNQVIEGKDTNLLGLPLHPEQTTDLGSGNHCNHKTAFKFDCIMYESTLANDPVLWFCPTCAPYIIATDYSYVI